MSELKDESLLPKNRIEALCDGIFAITMTIMILDLKTPENIPYDLAKDELPKVLLNLLPSVEAYVISFLVLGIFWLRHQINLNTSNIQTEQFSPSIYFFYFLSVSCLFLSAS